MNIKELIGRNQIQQAINLLPSQERFHLLSRWNGNEQQNRLGVISESSYQLQRNRIVSALIELANDFEETSPTKNIFNPMDHTISNLQSIISDYKRRDPMIATSAKNLLKEYRNYQDELTANPAYDPSGRRLKMIKTNIKSFLATLEEKQLDELESTVSRINNYIQATVPTYDDLEQAFKLCQGRGMNDSWIGIALTNRVEDNEVRIEIAERIEKFLSKL